MRLQFIILLLGCFLNSLSQKADTNLLQAIILIKANEYTQAIEKLSGPIIYDNSKYQNYLQRGIAYYNLKNLDNALLDFLKCEQLKKGVASLWIARVYAQKGNSTEAIRWLEINLQSEYKIPQSQIKLDNAFIHLDKTTQWIALWKKEWYSENDIKSTEAEYLIKQNKNFEAIDLLTSFINKNPNYAPAFYLRSIAYNNSNNTKAAIEDITTAIQLFPNNDQYYISRAKYFIQIGKYSQAITDCSKAQEINPYNIDIYFIKSQALKTTQKIPEALETLTPIVKYSNDTALLFLYANLLISSKQYSEALQHLNKIIQLNATNMYYYIERASIQFALKSYLKTIDDAGMALDLNPKLPQAYFYKGLALIALNDSENGCINLKKAFSLGYKPAYTYINQNCNK